MLETVDTTYAVEKLQQIAKVISTLPKDKKFIRKIERLIQSRQKMFDTNSLDWAMAEHLAYGSLLEEGYDVRISGQDVERGTFSHRHAIVKAEDSEAALLLLNNISSYHGKFKKYKSNQL